LKFERLRINLDVNHISGLGVGALGISIGLTVRLGAANMFVMGQRGIVFGERCDGDTGRSARSGGTGSELCFQNEGFLRGGGGKFCGVSTILTALFHMTLCGR
jgi:hypothetical protein